MFYYILFIFIISIQIYPRQRVAVGGQCHVHDALHPGKEPCYLILTLNE